MKYKKILQVLAVVVTLTLLVMTLPTTTALAKETLNLSPSKGVIGDEIEVTGSGYDSGDRIYIYFSSQDVDVNDDISDLLRYLMSSRMAMVPKRSSVVIILSILLRDKRAGYWSKKSLRLLVLPK